MEKCIPLCSELTHHGSVCSRAIPWAKGHNRICILFVVGGKKGEFFLVRGSYENLVEPLVCICADEV